MLFHANPIVLNLLGIDHAVDAVDEETVEDIEETVEDMLDQADEHREFLQEEGMLDAMSVRDEQVVEVEDLVSFLESENVRCT